MIEQFNNCWAGLDWTGLDWTGLDWTGLDWTGLDWTGLDWTGLDWTGLEFTAENQGQKKMVKFEALPFFNTQMKPELRYSFRLGKISLINSIRTLFTNYVCF